MSDLDILFVDLLYQPKGSFDDDFTTIAKSVKGESIYHLRVAAKGRIAPLVKVIWFIFRNSPCQVVFLSAKIWQLIVLAPLAMWRPSYVIYHFRPNVRARLHDLVLPLLSRVYKLAAYSENVRRYLCDVTSRDIPIVASRLIDKRRSINNLHRKLAADIVDVFCPGIRPGVRMPLEYDSLRKGVESALGLPVRRLMVQDAGSMPKIVEQGADWVPPMLSDHEYASIYREALIVAMKFYPGYEVRSSAMINDALSSGCIVVTDAHPIALQYGYPNGLVTDIEHLSLVVERVRSGDYDYDQIPGFDQLEARQSWIEFLKLGE